MTRALKILEKQKNEIMNEVNKIKQRNISALKRDKKKRLIT